MRRDGTTDMMLNNNHDLKRKQSQTGHYSHEKRNKQIRTRGKNRRQATGKQNSDWLESTLQPVYIADLSKRNTNINTVKLKRRLMDRKLKLDLRDNVKDVALKNNTEPC